MKTQLVLMMALLGAMTCASADIYRWVDAQGRVHYSDRPVQGAQRVGSVATHPSNPEVVADRAEAAKTQRDKANAAAQEQQTNQDAAKNVNQDVAKIQEERCKEAQAAYKTATESQRLYRTGKNGEREYLTNEEITTARVNALKAVNEFCGKKSS